MSTPGEGNDSPQDKWSGHLSNTKDGLDIARQLFVVIVIIVLIYDPGTFKETLAALGIKKVSVADVDIELTQASSEKAGDAAQRLEEAKKSTESTIETLDVAIRFANVAEQKKRLEAVKSELQESLKVTDTAEQKLSDSLAVQSTILQNVAPEDVKATGTWGIVISADKKLDPDALDEVKKAHNLGFQNVKVYDRQNWLRTVVEFPNFADARSALPQLRSLRSSSYLVNMNKWCSERRDAGHGVWVCPPNQ